MKSTNGSRKGKKQIRDKTAGANGCCKEKLNKNICEEGDNFTPQDVSLKILDKLFKESSAQEILKLGPRPELLGMTPLAMAASVGNMEAVTKLLAANADVNEKSDKDTTALMQVSCTKNKNLDIADLLLKHGASINDTNTNGDNAFMIAVASGDAKLVNKMWPFRGELNISHQNKSGNTALHIAAAKKWDTCIQFLLLNGSDVNIQNKEGWTPLLTAVVSGDLKAVERISNHVDTDLLVEDSSGFTALCKAIIEEKDDLADLLSKKLSDLDKSVFSHTMVMKLLEPPVKKAQSSDYYKDKLFPIILHISKYDHFRSSLLACKLIGHIINTAANNVFCHQIVTSGCFICILLMFRYSSGTDERFISQFMQSKGPEFLMYVLQYYEENEHGNLSNEEDVMTSCFLCFLPISDSSTGRHWIKENSLRLSNYIEKVKDPNLVNSFSFIDDSCKFKLKLIWNKFMAVYEDELQYYREENLMNLLKEEEREKLLKSKKRDRRKVKKQNKKQLLELWPRPVRDPNKKQQLWPSPVRDGDPAPEQYMISELLVTEPTFLVDVNNHSKTSPQDKSESKRAGKKQKKKKPECDNLSGDNHCVGESIKHGNDLDVTAKTKPEEEWVTVTTKKPIAKTVTIPATSISTEASKPDSETHHTPNARVKKDTFEHKRKVIDSNMSWAEIAKGNTQSLEMTVTVLQPKQDDESCKVDYVASAAIEETPENWDAIDDPSLEHSGYCENFPSLNETPESIWGPPCDVIPQPGNRNSSDLYQISEDLTNSINMANIYSKKQVQTRPPPGFSEIQQVNSNWWENLNTFNSSSTSHSHPNALQPQQLLSRQTLITNNVPLCTSQPNPTTLGQCPSNQNPYMSSYIEEQHQRMGVSGNSVLQGPPSLSTQDAHIKNSENAGNSTPLKCNAFALGYASYQSNSLTPLTINTASNVIDSSNDSYRNAFPSLTEINTNTMHPKHPWPDHRKDYDELLEQLWDKTVISPPAYQQPKSYRYTRPGHIPSDTVLYPSTLRGDPETSSGYSTQSSDNTDIFPSFHDSKSPLLFEELAKEQIRQHDRRNSSKLTQETMYHHDLDYYKSLYGLLPGKSDTAPPEHADGATSPLPEWASEPDNPNYEISSMPSLSSFVNPECMKSKEGEIVSRRWKNKLEEIRRLPDTLRRCIGTIMIPLQSAHYNIHPRGNSVILGHLFDGTEVAVKIVDPKERKIDYKLIERLNSPEIKHHFLLKYLAVGETSNRQFLASELCDYTLEEYVHIVGLSHQRDSLFANKLSWQLLKGLHYLHTEFTRAHGSLKPQTIYVDFDGKLRLGGYGVENNYRLARLSTKPCKKYNNDMWRSTECLVTSEDAQSTVTSDVQVAGMLIYYILTGGKHPYGENTYEIEVNICQNWAQLAFITEEANDLISSMLFSDTAARPTIDQCLGHPFFWSDEKRFRLVLIAGSDVLKEMKTGMPVTGSGSTTMIDFLNIVPTESVSKDWMADLDPVVLKEMRSFRQYKNSLSELVLFLYNCCLHFDKMTPSAREVMDDPVKYFPSKFPNLFMAVYRAIKVSDRTNRTCYKPFYSFCC